MQQQQKQHRHKTMKPIKIYISRETIRMIELMLQNTIWYSMVLILIIFLFKNLEYSLLFDIQTSSFIMKYVLL